MYIVVKNLTTYGLDGVFDPKQRGIELRGVAGHRPGDAYLRKRSLPMQIGILRTRDAFGISRLRRCRFIVRAQRGGARNGNTQTESSAQLA